MKFSIEGTRTRVITITVTEEIDGYVDITKDEVRRITECPAVIDGDSTGWYGEVEEALNAGAKHKITGNVIELEREEVTQTYWDNVEIDW